MKNQTKDHKKPSQLLQLQSAQQMMALLPEIMNLFYRLTKGVTCPADLTIAQFKILQSLQCAHKSLRMADLSQMLGVSQSTLTDTVKKLVKSGHLHRERCTNDDRVVYLSLTSKSEKVLDAHQQSLLSFYQDLFKTLEPKIIKKMVISHEFIKNIYADALLKKDKS